MRTLLLLVAIAAISVTAMALGQQPQPLQTIRTPGAAIAVSKDGKLTIGADETGPLRVLDFAASEKLSFEFGPGACTSLDLTGDGRLLAAVRDSLEPKENVLAVWDLNTKEKLWETPDGVFWSRFS
jgi:WD40 repeat protein